jgi:hypothetical protein
MSIGISNIAIYIFITFGRFSFLQTYVIIRRPKITFCRLYFFKYFPDLKGIETVIILLTICRILPPIEYFPDLKGIDN